MNKALHSLLQFPQIKDPRGNLSFIEEGKHIDFTPVRVFYLYDVPGGADRGGHALKQCHQVLIAISGSFDVILRTDGPSTRVQLNRPYLGLHIPPLVWRELDNFSSGSVCLVLASHRYSELDYFRNYSDFVEAISNDARTIQ